MKRFLLLKSFALLLCCSFAEAAEERLNSFEVEGDLTWNTRNTVQSPVDSGTKFQYRDLGDDPFPSYRLSYERDLGEGHELKLVYAPLRLQNQGRFSQDVLFENESYSAQQNVQGNYQFNTYRVSYRYLLFKSEQRFFKLGGTILIRDAEVRLADGVRSSKTLNLGIVPLVHFRMGQLLTADSHFVVEGDALAAPQGYAIDLWSGVQTKLRDNLDLGLGYRFLDGGADNDSVYTFSSFHSVGVKLAIHF